MIEAAQAGGDRTELGGVRGLHMQTHRQADSHAHEPTIVNRLTWMACYPLLSELFIWLSAET